MKKPVKTIPDRITAVERELAAIKKLLTPPVKPWWEVAYPKAYSKEKSNG